MEQIYFGQRIAALRRQHNLTQEVMAQKLGVTNQAVSKWETDQCCPDIMQLPQIAELFGITLDALFGRESMEAQSGQVAGDLPWKEDGCLRAVCFLGRRLLEHQEIMDAAMKTALQHVELKFTGNVEDLHSAFSVTCIESTIHGDVTAGAGVNCGNVGGDVTAGTGANCGNVDGDVTAGAGVNCSNVSGDVNADGNVNCAMVGSDVSAGDSIRCGDIEGDASAGGDLHCGGSIGGDATAGGDIVYQQK